MTHQLPTLVLTSLLALAAAPAAAQRPGNAPVPANSGVVTPAHYVVGPQDVLSVVFWREKEMSADVVVRPDGKISLPLLNDIQAAGLTPEALRHAIAKDAQKYLKELQDSDVTVVVKEINSRKVYVTGQVIRGGEFPLANDMTVLQAISVAGGLLEYADASDIVVVRKEGGREQTFKFNYKDVIKGRNLAQNITLKPGDTIIVP